MDRVNGDTTMELIVRRASEIEPRSHVAALPALVDIADGEDVKRPAWEALVRHEPRLASLLADARRVRDPGDRSFCANDVWYREFKPRLVYLVGWSAERCDPMLSSGQAYDLAYQTCYDALPDCRNCWCG